MNKTTKTLLILSMAGLVVGMAFVTGLLTVGNLVALYVVLPLGTVFFGLFLISLMLEKETALFDNDQRFLSPILSRDSVQRLDSQKDCCSAKARRESKLASAGAN
jgi:hypothetical protein